MKNITQYFDDSVKLGSTSSNDEAKEEYSYNKKGSRGKRNRVKIKISRSSTSERICDILENSNDMIDKTPSPLFSKENGKNENQRDTPKRSSALKSILATRSKTLTDNDQNVNRRGTNNCNSNSSSSSSSKKKQTSEDGSKVCSLIDRELKKERSDKVKSSIKIIDERKLVNIDSNDEEENDKDESNAFAILMGHNKPHVAQCAAQTSPPDANVNAKKSEEYKEKLKRTREKLEVLADKRGYSKRKIAEMEESKEIEEMIKDRLKLFKGEKKKDDGTTASSSQKQSPGTLLSYFSKAPVESSSTPTGVTTVVVKADVHATQSDDQCRLANRSITTKQIRRSGRNKRLDLDLSRVDDIKIVESENVIGNKGKRQTNKRKWSLKVNLQASEYEDTTFLGDGSDEEIFTPRTRLNMENRKRSETPKSVDLKTDSPIIKGKIKTIVPKQADGAIKLRKKKNEGAEDKSITDVTTTRTTTTTDNDDTENERNGEWSVHNENDDPRRKTAKLAPLFTKRKKPDPEAIAARRLFLRPNTTDTCVKSTNRKMAGYSALPFPLISHVTQLSGSCSVFSGSKILDRVPKAAPTEHVVSNLNDFKDVIDCSKKKSNSVGKLNRPMVSDVLAELGKNCSNVKEMWDVISVIKEGSNGTLKSPRSMSKRMTQSAEKKKKKKKKEIESIDGEQLEYCCWTYKYRPKCSGQVIGNDEAVGKLKDWLVGWSAVSTNEDSGDEFYQSDNSRSTSVENNRVAVLLGPHGCGKTASVYAIAEEFGYTVLELNASSRRTGKKLSKELEEATKSHRIKNNNGAAALCHDTDLDEIESKNVPRNSLILLEDVDLIFEEDEGFVSAAYQLASNSKRPIVMTCRDVCPHLNKMAPQQNKIYFQRPSGNKISALLELISLAETGYRLPDDCKIDLLLAGDLRRSLLQLQYLLLSGPLKIFERSIDLKNSFWHNVLCNVYKPAIKTSKKSKKRRAPNNGKMSDNGILIDLASKLDDVALMSSLTDVRDTALDLSEIKVRPGLSLAEDTSLYSSSSDISLEISEWIGNKVMRTGRFSDSEIQLHNSILLKKQINKNIDLVLSRATSSVLDRRILATDYLPSIRTVCRAENSRVNANNKRGNRFFHYLHNLKAAAATTAIFKPHILSAACNMMHDAIDE